MTLPTMRRTTSSWSAKIAARGTVVALGPELAGARGLDQADREAQPLPERPEAAFKDIGGAELGARPLRRHGGIAVGEGRRRRQHVELAEAAELGRDVARDAIAEMAIQLAVDRGERQHGDRRAPASSARRRTRSRAAAAITRARSGRSSRSRQGSP